MTASGKGIVINANPITIASGDYTLSVKTSEDGALTTVKANEINWEKTVYFKMVQHKQPTGNAPVDDATQSGGNAGLWIGVGIVALAVIVVVLTIMAVRKKRK